MSKYKSLEVGKFSWYVAIPLALTLAVVYSPATLNRIISSRSYVIYPPEGPRPPPVEEILARIQAEKEGK